MFYSVLLDPIIVPVFGFQMIVTAVFITAVILVRYFWV